MKSVTLPAFLFLFILQVSAQKLSVKLDPIAEIPISQNLIKIEKGFLSCKIGKSKGKVGGFLIGVNLSKILYTITILKYDESLKIIKENDLSTSSLKFSLFEPSVERINGRSYLFYYHPIAEESGPKLNVNEEGLMLRAVEIDPETLSLGNSKDLLTIKFPERTGQVKLSEIFESRKLIIENSADSTKTLVFFTNGVDNSFSYSVLDKELNLQWTKHNSVEVSDYMMVTDVCVDNTGSVFTAYKAITKKEGRIGHIHSCNSSKKEKDVSISPTTNIYDLLLVPSNQGYLNVVGTCFGETDYISGIFSAKVSAPDLKVSEFKRTDLEEQFIQLFSPNFLAYTTKKKYGLSPSKMEAYRLQDGTVGMIGEIKLDETWSSSHQNVSGSYNSRATRVVRAGSIFNAVFSEGKVVLSRVPKNWRFDMTIGVAGNFIPPSVHSTDLRFASMLAGGGIYVLPYNNELLVFYSDEIENLALGLSELPRMGTNSTKMVLVAATISKAGEVKRQLVMNLTNEEFIGLPGGLRKTSAGSLLLPIRKVGRIGNVKDEFRWATIDIN